MKATLMFDYPRMGERRTMDMPSDLMGMFRRAFPTYRGRTFRVNVTDQSLTCTDTYWDGGSKSEYVFLRLMDGKRYALPDFISGGFLSTSGQALQALRAVAMPAGVVCVRHSIFCGKDMGLMLTVRRKDVAGLLGPEQLELRAIPAEVGA